MNRNFGAIQGNNGNNRQNRNNGRNGNRNRNHLPNHNLGAIQVNEPQVPLPERTNEQIKSMLETPRKQPFVTIPNVVKQVETVLQQTLDPSMTQAAFSALLLKYNAIVSGSFMLYALGLIPKLNDIDIYVNCKHLNGFRTELLASFPIFSKLDYVASTYCVSFMRKNGIRSVQTLNTRRRLLFDVMGVRNKRKPSDVVQNFDLTFCQVWYDGRMVYATHPAHVFGKVGYLQKEYIPTFLQGNHFLQNRIEKYSKRGFMVTLDPNGLQAQLVALQENPGLCSKPDKQLKIQLNGKNVSVANDWAFRAILEFTMTAKYTVKTYTSKERKTVLPALFYNRDINNSYIDGYDSDDYNPPNYENLFAVAKEKAVTIDPSLAENTPEECFYHLASRLIQNMMSLSIEKNPYLQTILGGTPPYNENIDRVKELVNLDNPQAVIQYWMPYIRALQAFSKREGEDFAADEGQLYDFHNHPLDAGVTKDTLEGYLREKLESRAIKNPNQIPCFWQHSGCTQHLTMDQLRPVISDELRHTLEEVENETPNPSIFNSAVTRGDDILKNTQSSTDSWGAIYHQSICPFCMVSVDRDRGCAYMNHGTSTILPIRSVDNNIIYTPGCQKSELVNEIRDKYIAAINTLETNGTLVLEDPSYGYHLEFCVECGRPCVNHQHLTAFTDGQAPGIEPPRAVDAGGIRDYGKCDGGGRAEMFARVLAIRKVLRTYTGSNKKEQRRLAALAADAAPRDAALMARAAVIEAAAPTDRAWGNAQPINRFNEDANAPNGAANMNAPNGAVPNGAAPTLEESLQEIRNTFTPILTQLQEDFNNNLHTEEYYLQKMNEYRNELRESIFTVLGRYENGNNAADNRIEEFEVMMYEPFSELMDKINERFADNSDNAYNADNADNAAADGAAPTLEESLQEIRNTLDPLLTQLQEELNNNIHTKDYYIVKIEEYTDIFNESVYNLLDRQENGNNDARNRIEEFEYMMFGHIAELKDAIEERFADNADNQEGGSRRKKHTRKQRGAKLPLERKKYRHSTHKTKRVK